MKGINANDHRGRHYQDVADIEILRKSYALLLATRIEKYQIIDELRKCYPLTRICHVLNIQSQSYYKWQRKGKPKMNRFNQIVDSMITFAYHSMKGVYGILRLKHSIDHQYCIILNHKLIRRYKKAFDSHLHLDIIAAT